MDVKAGDSGRCKRKTRGDDDDRWECSVCTYMNPSESYKCEICFMRKGTSTRKPRLNPQVVEQQQLIAQAILKEKDEEHRKRKTERCSEKPNSFGSSVKLKNFDRSSPLLFEIFANGYSVVITEFQLRSKVKLSQQPESPAASTGSSLHGFPAGFFSTTDQLSPTDSNSTVDACHRLVSCSDFEFSESGETKPRISSMSHKGTHSTGGKSTHTSPSELSSKTTGLGHSSTGLDSSMDETKSHPLAAKRKETSESGTGEQKHPSSTHVPCSRRVKLKRVLHPRVAQSKPEENGPPRTINEQSSDFQSSERLSSPLENSQPPSSRLRRHRFQFDPHNTYVFSSPQSKRRKGSCRGLQSSNSTAQRYLQNSPHRRSTGSRTNSTWSNMSRQRKTTRRPLRITVSRVGSPTASKHCKYESRLRASSPGQHQSRKRRNSTTQSDLKCKIRVHAHQANHNSDVIGTTGREAPPSQPKLKLSSGSPRTALAESPSANTEPNQATHARLSTESRNTSAMTDSSGASALEMSH